MRAGGIYRKCFLGYKVISYRTEQGFRRDGSATDDDA